jgi:hypothetical protein
MRVLLEGPLFRLQTGRFMQCVLLFSVTVWVLFLDCLRRLEFDILELRKCFPHTRGEWGRCFGYFLLESVISRVAGPLGLAAHGLRPVSSIGADKRMNKADEGKGAEEMVQAAFFFFYSRPALAWTRVCELNGRVNR